MKQSSKRLTSMLGSLFFVVAALIVFFEFVQPEYGNVATLRGQLTSQKALLQQESTQISQVENLIQQYKTQSQNESDLSLALPSGEDLAGGIAQLYGLAENNGMGLTSISISAPSLQPQATAGGTTPQSIVQPVGSISFQVALTGSYEQFKNFLSQLETNIRIFDMQSVSVQPTTLTVGKTTSSGDFFTFNIEVSTYYELPVATSTNS